jgi:hypothetical protein
VGNDPTKLKEVMVRQNLTWRSFVDPGPIGQGPIARRWNAGVTPTFYIVDHTGTIRRKWLGPPGEKVIDAALEKLVEEAEKAGTGAAPDSK